jgi:hypothetical protein
LKNSAVLKMQYLKLVVGAGAIAMILTIVACAPSKKPLTCEAHLHSPDGGSIDVSRIDPNPALPYPDRPLHIFWHPPADGAGMDLIVGYPAATLQAFGTSNGGRVQFAPGISSRADQFQALFSADGSQTWRFGVDPDFGSDQGDFIISKGDSSGGAVSAALNDRKSIKVVILKDGKAVGSESFDTSATVGRDLLLAQARQLIERSDPRICHPE